MQFIRDKSNKKLDNNNKDWKLFKNNEFKRKNNKRKINQINKEKE